MQSRIPAKGLMVATSGLLVCAALLAQSPGRSEWLLQPQLTRGQEITYTGWFTEDTMSPGVQRRNSYRLNTSLLVLEASKQQSSVAVLTVLSLQEPHPGQGKKADPSQASTPSSTRLEILEVEPQGRVQAGPGVSLAVPLDGPPTSEWGALVELPRAVVGLNQFWEVPEGGRPPRSWRVSGTEVVHGAVCVKLVGTQQSADWDLTRGRADQTAWRRVDTVWLAPQLGVAYKVERVIERRDPARTEPTYRSVLRYERDSLVNYQGKLFDDCAAEIEHARKFQQDAAPLLRQPALYRGQIDALLKRIDHHLQRPQPVGAYRKAVVQVRRRVEGALRGQVTPEPGTNDPGPVNTRAVPGQRVPDFVVTELINHQSVRLYRLLGRPVVLMFYNPGTEIGRQVLRFGQTVSERYRPGVTVLGLAVTDNEDLVRRQQKELGLTFPILDGKGLHQTYGVDTTPRLVVLDGEGIFRGGYTGWGDHTAREVAGEVQRWLPK